MLNFKAEQRNVDRKDAVESKLVATVMSMGRRAKIHPSVAMLGQSLSAGYRRSSTRFLICNTALEVKVDQNIMRKETERL